MSEKKQKESDLWIRRTNNIVGLAIAAFMLAWALTGHSFEWYYWIVPGILVEFKSGDREMIRDILVAYFSKK